jgi:hypothetical protein
MATDHLSALDATFLELEQADPSAHMHIGAVIVMEPPAGRAPPSLQAVFDRLSTRLDLLPQHRRRLSESEVGVVGFPAWEPDPEFRLDAHVRRAALPAPGGPHELLEWAGDFYSHRLDRSRPCGSWSCSRASRVAAGRSRPRRVTAWPTASARWTPAWSCWTPTRTARRCRCGRSRLRMGARRRQRRPASAAAGAR